MSATYDKILIPFGKSFVQDLQKSLRKKGVTFGPQDSKLSGKIRYQVIEGSDKVTFQLIMPEYGEYVDKGRGETKEKGTGVLRDNIASWVKRKGIVGKSDLYKRGSGSTSERFSRAQAQLAFLISRKIHRDGFKGTHFYSEVAHDGRLDQLQKDLSEAIKKDVVIEIIS